MRRRSKRSSFTKQKLFHGILSISEKKNFSHFVKNQFYLIDFLFINYFLFIIARKLNIDVSFCECHSFLGTRKKIFNLNYETHGRQLIFLLLIHLGWNLCNLRDAIKNFFLILDSSQVITFFIFNFSLFNLNFLTFSHLIRLIFDFTSSHHLKTLIFNLKFSPINHETKFKRASESVKGKTVNDENFPEHRSAGVEWKEKFDGELSLEVDISFRHVLVAFINFFYIRIIKILFRLRYNVYFKKHQGLEVLLWFLSLNI